MKGIFRDIEEIFRTGRLASNPAKGRVIGFFVLMAFGLLFVLFWYVIPTYLGW